MLGWGRDQINHIKINNTFLELWLEKLSNSLHESLEHIVNEGFILCDGCVLLSSMCDGKLKYEAEQFIDRTGFECFYNHLHVEDYAAENHLEIGLLYLFKLGQKLKDKFPERKFKLILSKATGGCTVRFHCVRGNENWIDENLDHYQEESIFTIDF